MPPSLKDIYTTGVKAAWAKFAWGTMPGSAALTSPGLAPGRAIAPSRFTPGPGHVPRPEGSGLHNLSPGVMPTTPTPFTPPTQETQIAAEHRQRELGVNSPFHFDPFSGANFRKQGSFYYNYGVKAAMARFKLAGPMGADVGVAPRGPEFSHGTALNQYPLASSNVAGQMRADNATDSLWNLSEYDRLAPGTSGSSYGQETIG